MMVMRRIGGIAAALALFGAAPLAAQYFGQNKVQYQAFDFRIIQTEHFEVYYYPAERTAALDAARMAERWYARLSRILHHQFQGRKPIILYASQSDFQQTNTTSEDLGEGTGGFTEFFKHRMVLPFTGSYAELEHVLGHEMVHQFQYDVISRGRIGAGVQTLVNANLPGWFMEGMAEYLSIGPIDPLTSMWLRDASLEGHLPTVEEMTYDPRIFPYRFGHALLAYVGEKWGDEAIGQILQAAVSSGVEGGFKRALGVTLDDLSSEWRDAVQTTYLPQLADHYRARRIAQPLLTQKRSDGTLHLAPALSPDGREIAYFSEKNSFFVDLYLADAETGRVKRRLVKSTLNSNYESLRFINSAGSFSPDGRYFAIAAKRRDRDDLVILDVKKDEEVRRIRVPLNGLTTPSWSPDGKQLVFTGYDGGLSDLFVVNADGTNLHRLTNDKYADLEPSWSPDGKRSRSSPIAAPQRTSRRSSSATCGSPCSTSTRARSISSGTWTRGRISIPPGPRTAGRWRSSPTATGSATSSCTTCRTGRSTSSPTCSRESRASPRCHRASPGRTKPIASRSPTTKTANTTCTRSTTPARSNGSRTRHPPRRRSPRCSPRNAARSLGRRRSRSPRRRPPIRSPARERRCIARPPDSGPPAARRKPPTAGLDRRPSR